MTKLQYRLFMSLFVGALLFGCYCIAFKHELNVYVYKGIYPNNHKVK